MLALFESIGRYVLLMQKVFSRPEKMRIYYSRIMHEMEALGLNSIGLTAIISVFIGSAVTLQMAITLAFYSAVYDRIRYTRGDDSGVLIDRCGADLGR